MTHPPQRIAVVGSGVAGLTAAWLLNRRHQVDVFEKNDYAGGHTRTVVLPDGPDAGTPIDTGFIVMNHRNYPLLTRLLDLMDVEVKDSDMSFGYTCEATGYAYAGTNLGALFARPSNLWNRGHWQMLRDILRFNKRATRDVEGGQLNGATLGEYLAEGGYSDAFAEHYLLAMGSAIWSAPSASLSDFPAQAFLHFFHNHGLLTLNDRPAWKYVLGGSHSYVKRMRLDLGRSLQLNRDVRRIRRTEQGPVLTLSDGSDRAYDRVVVATHADEALALLADPSDDENRMLGAWTYQANHAVLHHDPGVMPAAPRAWAAWNFTREAPRAAERTVSVTYYMNRLQRLDTREKYFVSLNRSARIPDEKVVDHTVFTHPVFTHEAMATQKRLKAVNGKRGTFFCGSYFGYGFHEDAVRSGIEVAEAFGIQL